ncbi:MAG: peptidylprolyl isomerase [Oscillospiraceae bacterium]|nr:peptidylprolyl isomerase [Oscillospiraceae bacterium]
MMKKICAALLCGAMAITLTGCSGKRYNVKSSKPAVIDGFDGNVVDVSPKSGDLIATFEIEGFGEIKAVLFPKAAPVGVENFQKLCDSGYYEGLKIHRVRENFMFQGGSLNGDGTGGDAMVNGGEFDIETAQNARHYYGALCYANAAGKNSTQFYIVNSKAPQTIDTSDTERITNSINLRLDELTANAKNLTDYQITNNLHEIQYDQNTLDFKNYATDEVKARYREVGGYAPLDGNYTVFGQVYKGFDVVDAISAVEVEDNGRGEKSSPVEDIIINKVTVSIFLDKARY